MIVSLVCGLTVFVIHQNVKQDLMRDKAAVVATAMEASTEMYGSASELVAYIKNLGARTASLKNLALVQRSGGLVVASSAD